MRTKWLVVLLGIGLSFEAAVVWANEYAHEVHFDESVRGRFFGFAEYGAPAVRYAEGSLRETLRKWQVFIEEKSQKAEHVKVETTCGKPKDMSLGRDGAQYESKCHVRVCFDGAVRVLTVDVFGITSEKVGERSVWDKDFNPYSPYVPKMVYGPVTRYGSAILWQLLVGPRSEVFSVELNGFTQRVFHHTNSYVLHVPVGHAVVEERFEVLGDAFSDNNRGRFDALTSCLKNVTQWFDHARPKQWRFFVGAGLAVTQVFAGGKQFFKAQVTLVKTQRRPR